MRKYSVKFTDRKKAQYIEADCMEFAVSKVGGSRIQYIKNDPDPFLSGFIFSVWLKNRKFVQAYTVEIDDIKTRSISRTELQDLEAKLGHTIQDPPRVNRLTNKLIWP